MEINLGKKLFIRNGRKLDLTSEGENLSRLCREMFEIAEEIERQNVKSGQRNLRTISIGVSADIERPFVANIIGKSLKKIPADVRPQVKMVSSPKDDLNRLLKMGKLDFLISDYPPHDSDLLIRSTFAMPVAFFMSSNLAEQLGVGPRDSFMMRSKKRRGVLHCRSFPFA